MKTCNSRLYSRSQSCLYNMSDVVAIKVFKINLTVFNLDCFFIYCGYFYLCPSASTANGMGVSTIARSSVRLAVAAIDTVQTGHFSTSRNILHVFTSKITGFVSGFSNAY